MGSTMRPTIFNDRVARALRNWHQKARRHTKHGRRSGGVSPQTSRPATPSYGMSPVHLLQSYHNHTVDMPPSPSNFDNERWYREGAASPSRNDDVDDEHEHEHEHGNENAKKENFEERGRLPSPTQLPPGPSSIRTQHAINISLSDFSFGKT